MNYNMFMELPIFHPEYKKWIKYGYKNTKEKLNLNKVLLKSSHGYCMYCYSRVLVDEKNFGNLEHAIEKANSKNLIECIPNIGMTCPKCNQVFKKTGEQKRKLSVEIIREFESKSRCSEKKRKQCTVPCKALKELRSQYNELHIKRFRLNDPQYRTRNLFEFIKGIIDNDGKMPQYEFNNLIVEQFYEAMKGKSETEILKVCKSIYSIVFLKI